jgi:hypothetical protein
VGEDGYNMVPALKELTEENCWTKGSGGKAHSGIANKLVQRRECSRAENRGRVGWKKIWRLLKNLNIDLPYDPVIPLLGIYPKECDTGYSRGTCTPMFIEALFTIAKLWKQPRCPTTDEWIKKMWYLYTMEFYAAMKKNKMLSFSSK